MSSNPYIAIGVSVVYALILCLVTFRSHGGEAKAVESEPSPEMLEAMREVDAMLPNTTPIAPPVPAAERRAIEAATKRERFLARFDPPEATRIEVYPVDSHGNRSPARPVGPRFTLVKESGRVVARPIPLGGRTRLG